VADERLTGPLRPLRTAGAASRGALALDANVRGQGSGAFGAASLALLRFTKGPVGAGILLVSSLLLWLVMPALLAARRLDRADL
jgi:Cu-processing system permease protein